MSLSTSSFSLSLVVVHKLDSCALPSIALKKKKEMNGKNC